MNLETDFGACLQQIVTEHGETIRCQKSRFHNGLHESSNPTHIYRWKVESYPIGWQSDIDTRRQFLP